MLYYYFWVLHIGWNCGIYHVNVMCNNCINTISWVFDHTMIGMETLTLCETCFASSGLTQDRWTTNTQHNRLSVAEHCCDLVATWKMDTHTHKEVITLTSVKWKRHRSMSESHTWTFHIHKVRVGALNKTLLLVPPLLLLRGWVQQVFCELFYFFFNGTRRKITWAKSGGNISTIKAKQRDSFQTMTSIYYYARIINNPPFPHECFFFFFSYFGALTFLHRPSLAQASPQASYAFGPSATYHNNITLHSVQ